MKKPRVDSGGPNQKEKRRGRGIASRGRKLPSRETKRECVICTRRKNEKKGKKDDARKVEYWI